MKMKKWFFPLVLLMFLGIGSTFGQSGWSTQRHYARRGESSIQTNYQTVWNPFYNRWVNVRTCRQLNWYQEYYAGYVYFWRYNNVYGNYQWVSEYQEGTFWYCTWSGWYNC